MKLRTETKTRSGQRVTVITCNVIDHWQTSVFPSDIDGDIISWESLSSYDSDSIEESQKVHHKVMKRWAERILLNDDYEIIGLAE